jgi:hypothetical protein
MKEKEDEEETGSRFYDGESETSPIHTKQASKLGDTGPAREKKKHVRTPEIFQTGKAKRIESEERADTQNVHISTHFAVNKWSRPLDRKCIS